MLTGGPEEKTLTHLFSLTEVGRETGKGTGVKLKAKILHTKETKNPLELFEESYPRALHKESISSIKIVLGA